MSLRTAHDSEAVREATAHSIAEGVKIHPAQVGEAIEKLVAEYREKVSPSLISFLTTS